MKNIFLTAAALFMILCLANCSPEHKSGLVYTISPVRIDSLPLLKVSLEFESRNTDSTVLDFANAAWGRDSLHNVLKEVKLVQPEGKVEMNKDSGWIVIKHKNSGRLRLEYIMQQDFALNDQPMESYRPIIQNGYFHIFSHNLFMVPQSREEEARRDVKLNWEGFPDDWVIHNSFGSRQSQQILNKIELQKFHNAIFVGGDFRLLEDKIKDNRVILASRGEWVPFGEEEAMDILMETLKAQRRFWQDHSQEFFTVTLRPMELEKGSAFQGTGLNNSFAASISNNEYTDLKQLVYLFNHELQHNWIGQEIRNEDEEAQYWFSEGFTEYFTIKNIVGNRIAGLDESYFLQQINQTIRNLYTSPVKDVANSEINYENFWADMNYGKLPYYRGCIYAFYLDLRITELSNGQKKLDDLMRDILYDAKEDGQQLNHAYFVSQLETYLGTDGETEFEQYIEAGKPIELVPWLSSLDIDFQPVTKVYDLGFVLDDSDTQIQEVSPGSAAFMEGLRKGDKLLSRNIFYNDISKPVYLQVSRKGQLLEFEFLAVKESPVAQLLDTEKNRLMINSLF